MRSSLGTLGIELCTLIPDPLSALILSNLDSLTDRTPMESVTLFLRLHWLWLAVAFSLFWGFHGSYFFAGKISRPWVGSILRITYHFVFNFVGSFTGWACLYVLVFRLNGQALWTREFTGGDVTLFLLSFLGLTGHLPQTIYGMVQAVELLAKKAIERLAGESQ